MKSTPKSTNRRDLFFFLNFFKNFFIASVLLFVLSCKTEKEPNLNVNLFEGRMLDGTNIRFSEIINHRIAINVYSHTCIPCFKEIPTLNYLRKTMKENQLGEFYMVVEPYSLLDEEETKPFDEVFNSAKLIMEEEITKRGIELPVVVMKPPFKIIPNDGLITGTPETLLFKTSPLTLYYNFIGSISEQENLAEIKNNLKVQFFMRLVQ